MTRPKDFITREEVATQLEITIPEVSEMVATKVLTVDNHFGMIVRTNFAGQVLSIKTSIEKALEEEEETGVAPEFLTVAEVMLDRLNKVKERNELKFVIAISGFSIFAIIAPLLVMLTS